MPRNDAILGELRLSEKVVNGTIGAIGRGILFERLQSRSEEAGFDQVIRVQQQYRAGGGGIQPSISRRRGPEVGLRQHPQLRANRRDHLQAVIAGSVVDYDRLYGYARMVDSAHTVEGIADQVRPIV